MLAVTFVWNLIFAPTRLKREEKRRAGLESPNQVLADNVNIAVEGLERLMDGDEQKDGETPN